MYMKFDWDELSRYASWIIVELLVFLNARSFHWKY